MPNMFIWALTGAFLLMQAVPETPNLVEWFTRLTELGTTGLVAYVFYRVWRDEVGSHTQTRDYWRAKYDALEKDSRERYDALQRAINNYLLNAGGSDWQFDNNGELRPPWRPSDPTPNLNLRRTDVMRAVQQRERAESENAT